MDGNGEQAPSARDRDDLPGTGTGPGAAGIGGGSGDDTGGLVEPNPGEAEGASGEATADALGDREPGSATGAGASEGFADGGDPSAMSSDTSAKPAAAGLGGDAGAPGGMGGARAAGGTGTGRPPGGVSPLGGGGDED